MPFMIMACVLSLGMLAQNSESEPHHTGAPFDIVATIGTVSNFASNFSSSDDYQIMEYYMNEIQLGADFYITDYLAAGFNFGYIRHFEGKSEFGSSSISIKVQIPEKKLQPFFEADFGVLWTPYRQRWLEPWRSRYILSPGVQFQTRNGNRFSLGLKYEHWFRLFWEEQSFRSWTGMGGLTAGFLF